MTTSRTFLLFLIAILLLLIVTGLLRAAERPFRKIRDTQYKETPAYIAWLTGTAAMLALCYIPAVQVLFEVLDMIYGFMSAANTPANVKSSFITGLTTSCILILIATACFWFWTIISVYIIRPVLGKASFVEEMELNNTTYFIAKHVLILLFMMVMLPFYTAILRHFLPEINTPFYR